MTSIVPPLIVVEGHDVGFFSTIEEAENAIEPWWVKGREGILYDAAGHRLSITVVTVRATLPFPFCIGQVREKVRIIASEPFVDASEELRLALFEHLGASGIRDPEEPLSDVSLATLLDLVLRGRSGMGSGSH